MYSQHGERRCFKTRIGRYEGGYIMNDPCINDTLSGKEKSRRKKQERKEREYKERMKVFKKTLHNNQKGANNEI
jgi:hypothetical protein